MAKSKSGPAPALFAAPRSRRVLILPRFLEEEAEKQRHRDEGPALDAAHAILSKWADKESKGQLKKKETAVDANFLSDVFGTALRYTTFEHAAPDGSFTLDRQFAVPGVGPADGALGFFPIKDPANPKPVAIIELKGSDTDLDHDKSNGRTAVQQLFDYLSGLPDTKWGIVSNFSTIRLYHKDRGINAYEEFSLEKLKSDVKHVWAFWCLFEVDGMLRPRSGSTRTTTQNLLNRTTRLQARMTNEFFALSEYIRSRLTECLQDEQGKSAQSAGEIAEIILNRLVFVAICEAFGLFPPILNPCAYDYFPYSRASNPRWLQYLDIFWSLQNGHKYLHLEQGINHPLLAFQVAVDELQLDDSWPITLARLSDFDFVDEIRPSLLAAFFKPALVLRHV